MEEKKIDELLIKRIYYFFIVIVVLFIVLMVYISILYNQISKLPKDFNINESIQNKQMQLSDAYVLSLLSEISKNLTLSQKNINAQIATIKSSCSSDFSGIIDNSINSVVSIRTDVAQGTGFIISPDGYVVTNAHVLSYSNYGNALTAKQGIKPLTLIGYNTTLDLALLKINGTYDYLELRYPDTINVGERVIAIGNPLGLGFSVTEGIVSATDRVGGSNNLPAYIQTDVSLNPGNSGGPLIGVDGKVIGINNFKAQAENIGFAIQDKYIKQGINDIALQKLNRTIIN